MPELKLQQSRLDGRYDVVECLGRGSYAEIYVARDNAAPEGGPTMVVIKALNVFLQETPDVDLERTLLANFQNEAVALDLVRHPHIISRLGHGTAIDLSGTTFHYIVLEYLPGGDLAARARHNPLSLEQTISYLEQVCAGLAHAHRCGVIHRDIKPQNLLLSADHKIVKIADFGVARLNASEGSITRVGTNIYAAPEHNPLVQTGQLDTNALPLIPCSLTPAADIYSLAKTTYTLLAAESPRKFAQHPISELPARIANEYWSDPLLRVLEKATQTRAEKRYQSVLEFWDELSDAVLTPTRSLVAERPGERRRPSEDLLLELDEITEAPPQPRFAVAASTPSIPRDYDINFAEMEAAKRPRIVVPVSSLQPESERPANSLRRHSNGRVPRSAGVENQQRVSGVTPYVSRSRRFAVALILILAFSGMLLATHKYVTTHWNPLTRLPQLGEFTVVGREGWTTTDVNLRPDPSASNPPVGLATLGSRVKILKVSNNWFEVQVLEHGRPKLDPALADRGWLNGRFVRFE
ncbi:MAG TPA: serine/threonine protein kinase [Pyrinomonadaceae bacterium]|nr:serine/threonine protein kinase [Pyrinomonadaceae bacterium]